MGTEFVRKLSTLASVSTSKPGESLCGPITGGNHECIHPCLNLQAWRIPLWACLTPSRRFSGACLNLQAWRIPLWALKLICAPLVNFANGLNLQAWRIPLWGLTALSAVRLRRSLSQPPSLENPFVGRAGNGLASVHTGLNLQAWRIPLWVMSAYILFTESII